MKHPHKFQTNLWSTRAWVRSNQCSKGLENWTEIASNPHKRQHRTSSVRLTGLIAFWNKNRGILQKFTAEPRVYILCLYKVKSELLNFERTREMQFIFQKKDNKKDVSCKISQMLKLSDKDFKVDLKIMHHEVNEVNWSKWKDRKYKTIKGYLFSLKFHKFPDLLVCICSLCSFIKLLIFCWVCSYFPFTFKSLFACSHLFYHSAEIWLNYFFFLKHYCFCFNFC